LNKFAKIKMEYQGQEDEPTSDMVMKLLQGAGCTIAEMCRLGEDGKCEHPKLTSKSASGMPMVRYFSPAYVGTVQTITQEFMQRVDCEGKIELSNGTFMLAPLQTTGEFMVPLAMSEGASSDLPGNLWAMTVMGLTQIEIERCHGRIMSQALYRANISSDLISKYNGVFISSEVRKQEGQVGCSYYQHPGILFLSPDMEV
jgi:hypothetical protein